MAQFFTLLTDIGKAKQANAIALQQPIEITHLAVGDGGGNLPEPQGDEEQLINEVRRAAINTSHVDGDNPNWIVVEQVIPPDVGGWTIREVGIFDSAGDLIGYGNYPETYKPVLDEGSSRTQTVRFVLEVSDTAAVTLKIDPSVVLATREYVDTERAEHEAGREHPLATDTERGMVIKAIQTEVDAGTDDGKFVTAKKLKDWATNWVKQATETVAGMLKVATQAQVDAGTDDATAVTPKKLRWGVSYSTSINGYLALPIWLGGVIVQWGVINAGSSETADVTFPILFPNDLFSVLVAHRGTSPQSYGAASTSKSGFTSHKSGSPNHVANWIAVGH